MQHLRHCFRRITSAALIPAKHQLPPTDVNSIIRPARRWTQEEMTLLRDALEKFPPRSPGRWDHVSSFVGTRTASQCQSKMHYWGINCRRGSWSAEEDEVLLRLGQVVGNGHWAELRNRMASEVWQHGLKRTRHQCMMRWMWLTGRMRGKRKPWDDDEIERLLSAVNDQLSRHRQMILNGANVPDKVRIPWTAVAAKVGNGRSNTECLVKFLAHERISGRIKGKRWTEAEDVVLLQIYRAMPQPVCWRDVSAKMENRSAMQCYSRYRTIMRRKRGDISPKYRVLRWNKSQDDMLIAFVKNFQSRVTKKIPWPTVSAAMNPPRSPASCWRRYKELTTTPRRVPVSTKVVPWSETEIQHLRTMVRTVNKHWGRWQAIASSMDITPRSALQCSQKWKLLQRTSHIPRYKRWTADEDSDLIGLVRKYRYEGKEKRIISITWEELAKLHGHGKTANQCLWRHLQLLRINARRQQSASTQADIK